MALSDYIDRIDGIVKRDDLRGVYGESIDEEVARALGESLAEELPGTTTVEPVNIVVGHDMRLSGPSLAEALCAGIEQSGCRPIAMGEVGTELVGFLAAKYQDVIDGGVIITASHNPKEYTGFKLFGRAGQPLPLAARLPGVSPDDPLQRVILGIKKRQIPASLAWSDFAPDYIRTALEKGGCDFDKATAGSRKPMAVAVEAGNGMGGKILGEFARLAPQFRWTFANEVPDGAFPVIVPNPLNAEYQQMLSSLVKDTASNVGICFDGDADRVAIADEKGRMLSPPVTAALVGKKLREKLGSDQVIAHNLASSWVVADTLGERDKVIGDGPTLMTPVGYGKIKVIMHENPAIAFGAEHSGHYIFREFWCSDSGMLACLLMLELSAELHAEGKALSETLQPLRERYIESGEINFQLPAGSSVEAIIAQAVRTVGSEAKRIYIVTEQGCRLVDSYPPGGIELAVRDVRAEADNWWFCMRASGTEAGAGAILRLYVEACADRSLMEAKRDAFIEMIGPELIMK